MSSDDLVNAGAESANGEGMTGGGVHRTLPHCNEVGKGAKGPAITLSGRVALRAEPALSRAQRAVHKVSEHHFSGILSWGDKQPRRLAFESLLEYQAALCAIYRPGFEDIREQVGPILLQLPDGQRKTHFLDFCATFQGGHRVGMVVKPEVWSKEPAFKDEMVALLAAGRPVFFDRLVVIGKSNIDPVELANAELFHASRFSNLREDQAVSLAVKGMTSPMRIGELVAAGQSEGVTLRGLARAIRGGGLHLLSPGRIRAASTVMKSRLEEAA